MSGLVLSLFPGIGLLDRAFEEEGFCVVRGPDLLWGGDIRRFHPPAGRFDGVIGGPPCQPFSRLRHIVAAKGQKPRHPNLIPEFERCVAEARPEWFLMENVPDAPVPAVDDRILPGTPPYQVWDTLIEDCAVGGVTSRLRRFSFGLAWAENGRNPFQPELLALFTLQPMRAITGDAREVPVKVGGSGRYRGGGLLPNTGRKLSTAEMCEAQGLPRDAFADAPFTESARRQAIGNGVPLPMGRAVARAVKRALGGGLVSTECKP